MSRPRSPSHTWSGAHEAACAMAGDGGSSRTRHAARLAEAKAARRDAVAAMKQRIDSYAAAATVEVKEPADMMEAAQMKADKTERGSWLRLRARDRACPWLTERGSRYDTSRAACASRRACPSAARGFGFLEGRISAGRARPLA